jgi:hypothetical protein
VVAGLVDTGGGIVVLAGVELGSVEFGVEAGGVVVVVLGGVEVVPAGVVVVLTGVVEVCTGVETIELLVMGVVLTDDLVPEHPDSMANIVTRETSNKELAFIKLSLN